MRRVIGKKAWMFATFCLAGTMLAGCDSDSQEVVVIEQTPYEKMTYQTTTVKRGDLNPSVTLSLQAEGYEEIKYGSSDPELKLDEVHVSIGDYVEAGELLVSFVSEGIEDSIAEYEGQKKESELLIEHYEKLMNIDSAEDYSADIEMIREDIQVAQLYIEELQKKLQNYQIVASESGTITKISGYLLNGYYKPGSDLVTQVSGTGNYTVQTTSADEFQVGEIYEATAGVATYELKLKEKEEQTLVFEPVSDMSSVSSSENLNLSLEKPTIEDAVYVEEEALHIVENMDGTPKAYYVYLMGEDGYQDAHWVSVGDKVDGYVVITEGLSGGEKVTLK